MLLLSMSSGKFKHINGALPTAGHTPMYNKHKFFARKQADVIREYVQAYTDKDEIVMDPFCGSGVMVGESIRLRRKAIGIDINPVAIFITRNTVKYVDPEDIKKEYIRIKKDVADEINNLYVTKCRKCKNNVLPAICFTWNNERLVDVRYECPHHGRRIDPVNKEDLELYARIEKGKVREFFNESGHSRYWYPTQHLRYKDGTPFLKKERYESVDELFTIRNLVALAKLRDRIDRIENIELRDTFRFAFSSLTHLASKMTPVRPSRPFSSAWVQQSYWYCENNMESNVWDLFKRAVKDKQGLISEKKDLPDAFKIASEATKFDQIEKGTKQYYLLAESALDAMAQLGENTVDYIITDPPYGHSIQYAELLFMWGCWLKLMDDFNEIAQGEVIENPKQRKTEETYENMLYAIFRRAFTVLKPKRYCTITFHNPDLKYRNILFRSVVMAGFEFEKIVYQPAPRPSAKSLLQPYGSLEGDYFFRFKKPAVRKEEPYKTVDQKRVETLIVNITEKIIAERGEPTHYTFIQNSIDPVLYEELRKYGLLPDFQPKSVKETLEKYIGSVFTLVDVVIGKRGQKTLLDKAWWFVDPNEHRLDIPLNKRVDEAIANLLRRQRRVTFTEVLTEVYTRFQNALTPEEHTIMDILKENATPSKGGKWEIRPFIERIQEKHEEMVFYLAVIGEKIGYKVDVAKDEYEKPYQGKRLASQIKLSSVSLRGLSKNQTARINHIDVIWHDGKDILAEFEVEHSTSIVDAVVRGSNIKSQKILRVMAIPEEREDLVHRRLSEPAMQAVMKDAKWQIITYPILEAYYNQAKNKKQIGQQEFVSRLRNPQSVEEREERCQSKLFSRE